MIQLEFIYNGENIKIFCNINDKMEDIFKKFKIKTEIKENSIYYIYDGKRIDEKLKLKDIIKDKKINEIKILVYLIEEYEKNNKIIESKYIICPECKENIRIKIENYKIKLYECKNRHEFNNILLEEYENIQKIDISKIKCDKCENNKSNTYNNEFYRCIECKINLCPLCKLNHNKEHNIINYEKKNYICEIHNNIYIKYCKDCKMNICTICSNKHKLHNTIYYDNIIPDIEEMKKKSKRIERINR